MKMKITLVLFLLFPSLLLADTIVRIAPLTISVKSRVTTATGTATAIPGTALVGRETMAICNTDSANETVWIGASDVTSANGFPLSSTNPCATLDIDDSVVLYVISDGTSVSVASLEVK